MKPIKFKQVVKMLNYLQQEVIENEDLALNYEAHLSNLFFHNYDTQKIIFEDDNDIFEINNFITTIATLNEHNIGYINDVKNKLLEDLKKTNLKLYEKYKLLLL